MQMSDAKLALVNKMRRIGISRFELGRRLSWVGSDVYRVCDPDKTSHFDTIEAALNEVGLTLKVGKL